MTGFDVNMSGKSLSLSLACDRLVAAASRPEPRRAEAPPGKPEAEAPPKNRTASRLLPGGATVCAPPRPTLTRRTVVLACQAAAVFDLLVWHLLGRTPRLQLLVLRLLAVALCSCVCLDSVARFHACLLVLAASLHFEALWAAADAAPDRVSSATLATALLVAAHRCALAMRTENARWLPAVLLAALAACFASTLLLAAWLPATAAATDVAFLGFVGASYALVDMRGRER